MNLPDCQDACWLVTYVDLKRPNGCLVVMQAGVHQLVELHAKQKFRVNCEASPSRKGVHHWQFAVPNLLAARRAANESAAIASLRTLHGANITYQFADGNGLIFAPSLAALNSTNLIDSVLRRFVLQPLAEIAPDLVLPGLNNVTVAKLLESLPADDSLRRLE